MLHYSTFTATIISLWIFLAGSILLEIPAFFNPTKRTKHIQTSCVLSANSCDTFLIDASILNLCISAFALNLIQAALEVAAAFASRSVHM